MVDERIVEAMNRIPQLRDLSLDDVECEQQYGMTNFVFRFSTQDTHYCLRIPGEGTAALVDRTAERHNTESAIAAGFSPAMHYFDSDGLMLSDFLINAETLTPEKIQIRPEFLSRVGQTLRQIHDRAAPFYSRFDVSSMIDGYMNLLEEDNDFHLPDGCCEIIERSQYLCILVEQTTGELKPCHCDTICLNILNDHGRMWVVDWEYSGMNDPYWDLGNFAVDAELSEEHEWQMLTAYLGRSPKDSETARVVVHKALADLLWTLWNFHQHVTKNPARDFWQRGLKRFTRCQALMESEEFNWHTNAVRPQ